MDYDELRGLNLPEEVWSLIQRGLNHVGLYHGTYMGRPGPKTEAAYRQYIGDTQDFEEPLWMGIARNELGTKEFSGQADNPDVVKYLESVDTLSVSLQRNDETAWCAAFVNWCMEKAGIQGTESASARSWLNWGKELAVPVVGCVTVLWRGAPTGWKGHVGFFVKETSDFIYMLGGNQNDEVSIARYPKRRLLGYRGQD